MTRRRARRLQLMRALLGFYGLPLLAELVLVLVALAAFGLLAVPVVLPIASGIAPAA